MAEIDKGKVKSASDLIKKHPYNLSKEDRKATIANQDLDTLGISEDGHEVRIKIKKDKAMKVATKYKDNANWAECVYYNAEGEEEGVQYKHILDEE